MGGLVLWCLFLAGFLGVCIPARRAMRREYLGRFTN